MTNVIVLHYLSNICLGEYKLTKLQIQKNEFEFDNKVLCL